MAKKTIAKAKPAPRNKKLFDADIPACLDAFKTAKDVFKDRGI